MKKLLVLCALLISCFLLLPGHASATPFFEAYQVVDLRYVNADPSKSVTVTLPNMSGNYLAGQYNLLIDGIGFGGFCVEDVLVIENQTLAYQLVPLSDLYIGYTYAAWIADKYFKGESGYSAWATQLSIWEAALENLYDQTSPEAYTLADGDVYSASYSAETGPIIIALNNAIADSFAFDTTGWFVARNPVGSESGVRSQDFLVKLPAPVPEPATMLLLGSGLVGLAAAGRRKFLKK